MSVTELGKKPYLMKYNAIQLPAKNSTAVDYWGYYNGQINNQGLTPSIDLVLEEQNKRDVDQESTKAGILEEIIYPTGGKTKFIFENNKGDIFVSSGGFLDMISFSGNTWKIAQKIAKGARSITAIFAKDDEVFLGNLDGKVLKYSLKYKTLKELFLLKDEKVRVSLIKILNNQVLILSTG